MQNQYDNPMYPSKHSYTSSELLMMFVCLLEAVLLVASVCLAPFELTTLTILATCVIVYIYLSATVARDWNSSPRLKFSRLSWSALAIILLLEGYNSFNNVICAELGVLALAAYLILDFHNWKYEIRYGVFAMFEIFSRHAGRD
jgi:hypothetical protein